MKKELDQLFEKITEKAKAAPHEPADVCNFCLDFTCIILHHHIKNHNSLVLLTIIEVAVYDF